jgi:hypothetical protein
MAGKEKGEDMRITRKRARALLNESARRIHRRFKPATSGTWSLEDHYVTEEEVFLIQAKELHDNRDEPLVASKGMKPGTYWALRQKEFGSDAPDGAVTWMSTHVPERETNVDFLTHARGRVLIAGLGMGLILYPLSRMKGIDSVYVVEKNREVVELVKPYADELDLNLNIIPGDINEYTPPTAHFFNTIYFDIWPTINAKNVIEIHSLKKRFRPYLAPKGWIGAWVEEVLVRRLSALPELKKKDAQKWMKKAFLCKS